MSSLGVAWFWVVAGVLVADLVEALVFGVDLAVVRVADVEALVDVLGAELVGVAEERGLTDPLGGLVITNVEGILTADPPGVSELELAWLLLVEVQPATSAAAMIAPSAACSTRFGRLIGGFLPSSCADSNE